MLDQHLPVLTIDQWHRREEHCDSTVHKFKDNKWKSSPISEYLAENYITNLDDKKLAVQLKKLLNINNQQIVDTEISSSEMLLWKKGAKLYEDDDIVNYSLARLLKMRISNQVLEIGQITELEIIPKENGDLYYRISYKPSK